ncbi:MAG: hypothetical protein FD164_2375 [Nitrospirae bacterium]|nr:MAG: hypothetical protein FD164_2375 [Nitrospirota bacterium]
MNIMPIIPGQSALPASYARSVERPSVSFCRMLSAELTAGQTHRHDLQQLIAPQTMRTDTSAQLEESHKRSTPSVPLSEQKSQDLPGQRTAITVRSSVDVAAVLDFMQDASHIRNVQTAEKGGAVKLPGGKTEIIAGIRQKGGSAWDRYHMSSSGSNQNVGVFIGLRIAIG